MNMKRTNMTGPLLAIAMVLIIVGGGLVYFLGSDDRETENIEKIDTAMFTGRLTSLTTETISDLDMPDESMIEKAITERLPGWIDSSEYLIPGYSISIVSSTIEVTETLSTASIPSPPSALHGDGGSVFPNSLGFGTEGGIPLVPTIITDVDLELDLDNIEGEYDDRTINVAYSTDTVDPERTMDRLLDLIEDDMNGWNSGMARDVEYMLNALVKLRAKSGVGTAYTDTNYHLLNSGDVELAVNFAIAIRIARWTGQVPDSIANQIDSYFSQTEPSPLMNPTGSRSWGEAEKDNHQDYIERSRGDYPRRSAESILSLVETFGHSDPADIFLRFLYMDRASGSIGSKEPLDLTSPLSEDQVLDPRQPTDTTDPFSLAHHPGFPTGKSISVSDMNGSDNDREIMFQLNMDYMVDGKGLSISGIDDFTAWYTNADLSLTDDDLIEYGNTTVNPTRCGLVPPPQEPPGRDHRVQWDLDISGSMMIEGSSSGWSGNTYSPDDVERIMDFSFPVRIHTGTGRIYPEGFPGLFNINTGTQFRTNFSGGNVITPEANATEYFTARVWPEIKDAFGIITSLSRTAGMLDPGQNPIQARQNAHLSSMAAISSMSRWISGTDAFKKLGIFYLARIKEPGLDIIDIGPVRLDGHSIHFTYSPARDRMEIRSDLPEGDLSLIIHPITGGDPYVTSRIDLPSGNRIELDINEGTFSIHGNFGGQEVNEGSSIPSPPPDHLWNELGTGTYLISPSIDIDMNEVIDPHSGDLALPSSTSGNARISITLTGDEDSEISFDDLPELSGGDMVSLFYDTVPVAEEFDLHIGIRAEMVHEDGPMVTRTIVFGSLASDDLNRIRSTDLVENVIENLVHNTRMRSPELPGEQMVMTETVEGWELDMGEDPTFVVLISPLETISTFYFSGLPMTREDAGGWTFLTGKEVVPLW